MIDNLHDLIGFIIVGFTIFIMHEVKKAIHEKKRLP